MMTSKFKSSGLNRYAVLALVFPVLFGCSGPTARYFESRLPANADRTVEALAALKRDQPKPAYAIEEKRVFVTSRSVALSKDAILPDNIQQVTFRFPGRLSLVTIVERISRETGVPVILSPDALLNPSLFVPGFVSQALPPQSPLSRATTTGDAAFFGASSESTSALSISDAEYQRSFELNYSGSFAGLLDYVATRAGLKWRYEDGRVVFYRLTSRVFILKSLPTGSKISSNLTQSGGDGGSGSQTGGLEGKIEMEADYWGGIEKTLQGMVSRSGKVNVDRLSGVVTVTDSVEAMAGIERYIEQINKFIMRQVVLDVEVLTVDLGEEHTLGIDWKYINQNVVLNPTSLLKPTQAGQTAFSLGYDNTATGRKALISALQYFGRVSTAYSGVVTTSNRTPAPISVINTQSYVRQTTPSIASTSIGGSVALSAPGLTPGQVVTGMNLVLQPMILDSNQIMMQCVIGISTLKELSSFTSGSGSSQQTVQLPNVDAFTSVQRFVVPSGETMVILGYNQSRVTLNSTGAHEFLPLSKDGAGSRKSIVVLVTPRLSDV